MRITKARQRNKSTAKWLVPVLILLVATGGYLAYAASNTMWPFSTDSSNSSNKDGATIPAENEDYVQNGGGSGQGDSQTAGSGITDTEGKNVNTDANGVSSSSKNITLYNPAKNERIKNGDVISGTANVPLVYYRISDDVSGMISNGQLKVVDGKFSGVINVNTNAKNGTFEVYSFNAEGQEINNINIEVAY